MSIKLRTVNTISVLTLSTFTPKSH